MDAAERARFERLYQPHLLALKTQGKWPKTIEAVRLEGLRAIYP